MSPTPGAKWFPTAILALFVFRLFTIDILQLAPDEAYYWYWSRHLAWAYSDHPPMIALVMAAFSSLGGQTELFVRLGGFLLSAAALVLLFSTAKTLYPHVKGLPWAVLLAFNATLLFPAGCIIQTPDTPMLFFWVAALWSGSRILTGGPAAWWYVWGAALGLGLLSKYTMILIVPCTAAFLVLSPPHRFWFRRMEPYAALAIAFLLFSPVLYWNATHDWFSFAYQMRQGFSPKDKNLILKLLEYAGGQAGVVTPLLFIGFVLYSVRAARECIRTGNRSHLYLLCLSWPVLLFFGFSSVMGKVAEANWPAPAYLGGFILSAAVFFEHYALRRGHRRFVVSGLCLGLVLGLLLQIHLIAPFLPIPPQSDQTRQFHDWRSLGRQIDQIASSSPSPRGCFIISDKGTTAAEAVFYSGARFTGVDLFQPERYLFLDDLSGLRGKDAILVLHNGSESGLARYARSFRRIEPAGRHEFRFRGEVIEDLSVRLFVGRDFDGHWIK